MKNCRLTNENYCLVDMCNESAYEVNESVWFYRNEAKPYLDKKKACIETAVKFAEDWNTSSESCSKQQSTLREVLESSSFTSTEFHAQRPEILAKFEDNIGSCVRTDDYDIRSTGFQWHGILLVAALLTIFVGLLIRGKKTAGQNLRSNQIVREKLCNQHVN